MVLALIEGEVFIEGAKDAVDAGAHEALAGEFLEVLLVFAFAAANDGGHDHDAVVGFEGEDVLEDLESYPIDVDPETDRHAWGATLQLAIRYRLSLYDAAYLELAQRRRVPLATLDRDLQAAAKAEGITVLGGEE